MGQTLDNGIYLPSEGERNCYDGLASNWTTLDVVVGGYRAHIANENIHITSAERSKWNNGVTQAYVLRYANTSLTALGTVAFSALDNTDNVKIGDKVLDSEGKLFALTAVDTANSSATLSALLIDLSKDSDLSNYYTKTETDTLLSDKADDSGVVHKAAAETIPGNKTFSGNNSFSKTINSSHPIVLSSQYANVQLGEAPSSDQSLSRFDCNDKNNDPLCYFRQFYQSSGTNTFQIFVRNKFASGTLSPSGTYDYAYFGIGIESDKSPFAFLKGTFKPSTTNNYDLGTSTNKWKSLNGLNPGVLSMPNLSAGVDISGYLTNAGTTTPSEFTPSVNGWIVLKISADSPAYIRVYSVGGLDVSSYSERNEIGSTSGGSYTGFASVIIPCIVNDKQNIIIMPSTAGVISAKFYPCQGNV